MVILEGRIRDMSLNIKNEATHAKVRRLAELTGMSMTAVVDDAVERRLRELGDDPFAARLAKLQDAVAEIRSVYAPERLAELDPFARDLYDEATGLPR